MKIADLMQGDQNHEDGALAKQLNQSTFRGDSQEGAGNPNNQESTQNEGEAPTDEEQEIYDRVVTAALKVIGNSPNEIVQMLQSIGDPAQALADVTWTLISGIDEQAGGQIDEEILLQAGSEVMENLGELANNANIFEVNQQVLNQAYQLVLARFSEEFGVDFGEAFADDIQSTDEQTLLNQMGGQ